MMNPIRFATLTLAGLLYVTALRAQEQNLIFSRIVLPQKGTIRIEHGDHCAVRIEPEGKDNIDYRVEDGTLVFRSRSDDGIAHITMPDLERAEISGKGVIEADETVHAGKLDLLISGSGTIELPVEATEVHAVVSGKGNVILTGTASMLDVEISGAGKVDATGLTTPMAGVDITGAGKVITDTRERLDIQISGVGSVKYVKEPGVVNKSITGIGKVGSVDGGDDDGASGSSDTTTVIAGGKKIVIIGDDDRDEGVQINVGDADRDHKATIRYHRGDKTQAHWAGFELGFNNYFTSGFDDKLPDGYDFLELNTGKSVAVNLNVFDWKVNIVRHNLAFVTGMGLAWNNWRFRGDRTLIPNVSSVSANYDSIDYKKNKLTASYVTLPLLLEANTSAMEKKTFHLGVGVIGGYRIGSHTKQKYTENGKTRKVKTYDDFNLNTWRADATVRVGYRGFTFFASYGLLDLFKKDEGPGLRPFTFGLTLVNW